MAFAPSLAHPPYRDLFRFLLFSRPARLVYLLSFFRFFFWKKLRGAKRGAGIRLKRKGFIRLKKDNYEHYRKSDSRCAGAQPVQ